MSVKLDDVMRISREVVSRLDDRLSVVSAMITPGGANRVEVLISEQEDHDEPRRHLFNITRAAPDVLISELRFKLQNALSGG